MTNVSICSVRDLARIFITGCPNWDFKNLGCPKSLIEKVKIIILITYINKSSSYMLNSTRNVFVVILKLNFLEIKLGISICKKHIPKYRVSFYLKSGIFHELGSQKDTLLAKTL